MAEFNKENKVSYDDLAPSLQEMIRNSITEEELTDILNTINQTIQQLNGIRISIVTDTSQIPEPQNNKEVALVVGQQYTFVCTYNNGWKRACAVYA